MNKVLKKAAKNYKEKIRQPITIEFQEEHLNVISRALEVFQRLRMGQIDYALSEAFDKPIDYEDRKECHNFVRDRLFKEPELKGNYNASWGIFNQENVGDATVGYEIHKVLRRYRAFKNNDGWSDWGRDFDKPYQHTKVPLPVIEGFIDYKLFKVPKRLWKKIDSANGMIEWKKEVWEDVWNSIDKAMPKLPKGEKSEIIDNVDGWYIKVTAPMKPKEEVI
jgi:hypothetical protein